MPCHDYYPEEERDGVEKKALWVKIDVLTALLCESYQAWRGAPISDDLWEWWMKHAEEDEKRKPNE